MKCSEIYLTIVVISITYTFVPIYGASLGVHRNVPTPHEPMTPQVDINLSANLLATSLGQYGTASANQQVVEHASGDSLTPASITSTSGVQAELNQNGEIDEIGIANLEEGTSGTLNEVSVQNLVSVNAGALEAQLAGAHETSVEHSGETYGFGGGVLFADANTSNNLESSKKNEMKV